MFKRAGMLLILSFIVYPLPVFALKMAPDDPQRYYDAYRYECRALPEKNAQSCCKESVSAAQEQEGMVIRFFNDYSEEWVSYRGTCLDERKPEILDCGSSITWCPGGYKDIQKQLD